MPQRTCVICRGVVEKESLLRFVVDASDSLTIDIEKRSSGRGAYCHLNPKCLGRKELARRLRYSLKSRDAGSQKAIKDKRGNISTRELLESLIETVSEEQGLYRYRESVLREFREAIVKLDSQNRDSNRPKLKKSIRL